MTKRIIIRSKASQDLDDHFAYIAEKNLEAALQLFDSVQSATAQLARMLGIGFYILPKILRTRVTQWHSEASLPFLLQFGNNFSRFFCTLLRWEYFKY